MLSKLNSDLNEKLITAPCLSSAGITGFPRQPFRFLIYRRNFKLEDFQTAVVYGWQKRRSDIVESWGF